MEKAAPSYANAPCDKKSVWDGGGGAAVEVILEALLRYHNIRHHLLRRPAALLPRQDSVRSISTQRWEWLTWVSI